MSDTSRLFELLSATLRRRILVLLCETDSIRVPEGLRTRSASGRRGLGSGRASLAAPPDSGSLELQLVHHHLPKLAAAGVVEWDRAAGTVSRGRRFEEIEPALRLLRANADRFPDALL